LLNACVSPTILDVPHKCTGIALMMSKFKQLGIVAAVVFGLHTKCLAVTRDWDGGGDGITWGDGLNWDEDGVPAPSDDADIGMSGVLIPATHIFFIQNLDVGVGGELAIEGSLNATGGQIQNNGLILIDNGVPLGPAALILGAGTLEGTGEVVLGETIAASGASLVGSPTTPVTHVAGHTIRGEGQITEQWINNSIIRAEDVDGDMTGTLRIGTGVLNNGVIRSSATATLSFANTMSQGGTGRIVADAQVVQLNNSTFIGGSLEVENGGRFESTGNALRLNGVHLKGSLHMVNPGAVVGTLAVVGAGFTNDGTIEVSPDDPGASIIFTSTATIGGTGQIVMHYGGLGARINSDLGAVGTFGPGQTVRGAGQVEGVIINDGAMIAQALDTGVLAFLGPGKTNNNVIRADAGAVVRLTSTTINQNAASGRLVANEGTVELANAPLNSASVAGGRFQTVGAGTIEVTGSAHIDDVINEGVLNVQPVRTLTLGGATITNNGTINLHVTATAFAGAGLVMRNGVSLGGTGQVVLTPELPNKFNSISVPTDATATHAAGHTIRGEGLINTGGNRGTFINNGRLEGASAGQNIEISAGTLGGVGTLKNVRINANANHAPGPAGGVASVPIEGAYVINGSGARLQIQLGGTTAGTQYDQLASTDAANAITLGTGSILDVSLINLGNSYVPAAGHRFTILSSPNSIMGNFSTINLPTAGLGRAITWAPVDRTDPTKYILEIATVGFLAADFDEDFDVDVMDLDKWKLGFGMPTGAAHINGDANADGDVDGNDFLVWQRQLGLNAAAATPTAFPIPEPTSQALIAAFATSLLIWRSARSAASQSRVSAAR
jgi:hypothetical protein